MTVPLRNGAIGVEDVAAALRVSGIEVHDLRFDNAPWPGHVSFVGVGIDGAPVRGVVSAEWTYDDARAVLEAHVRVDPVGEEPPLDG